MAIQQNLADSVPDANNRAGSFEPAEGVKEVHLDPSGASNKTARVSSTLDPK